MPRYVLHQNSDCESWLDWMAEHHQQIDCLIAEAHPSLQAAFDQLKQSQVFLPTVVLQSEPVSPDQPAAAPETLPLKYHQALVFGLIEHLVHIDDLINRAIQQFVALPIASELSPATGDAMSLPTAETLAVQKERLTDKLKARLGYLGVYYKRSPENFFRNMRQSDRQELLQMLRDGYRAIILMYFSKNSDNSSLNNKIDEFVNQAFFADISVSQIVEIHMELMDEFSKQLLLEGRSDEILLDYRLTLIDVIAHLCEMYRRSIPREP